MIFIGVMMILTGLISLAYSYKHMLNMLLSLEFLMVGLMVIFFLWLGFSNGEGVFILYYIVFMVGEGVLGLSLLVSLVRWYGSDLFSSFSGLYYLYYGVSHEKSWAFK